MPHRRRPHRGRWRRGTQGRDKPRPPNPAIRKDLGVFCAARCHSARQPVPLWITLGMFLAQPAGYPQKSAGARSCCVRAPPFARLATQALKPCKSAPTLDKNALSTESAGLYYYCYLSIELSKNNQDLPKPRRATAGTGKWVISVQPGPTAGRRRGGFLKEPSFATGLGEGDAQMLCVAQNGLSLSKNERSVQFGPARRAHFAARRRGCQARCAKLGIVVEQRPGCPQKRARRAFYPRCRNSGTREPCTGLSGAQVRAAIEENKVVHTEIPPLLLRLCIYRNLKKKTEEQPGQTTARRVWTGLGTFQANKRRKRRLHGSWMATTGRLPRQKAQREGLKAEPGSASGAPGPGPDAGSRTSLSARQWLFWGSAGPEEAVGSGVGRRKASRTSADRGRLNR